MRQAIELRSPGPASTTVVRECVRCRTDTICKMPTGILNAVYAESLEALTAALDKGGRALVNK